MSGVGTRIPDTKQAMQYAHKAGLRAYLIVWQPSANSLPRSPQYMQVDSAGHQLETFDVFNPEWRRTEWKGYLQKLARAYGHEPAMAGYVFDDSFGPVARGRFLTAHMSSARLARRYRENQAIQDGMIGSRRARGWWDDWARDTVGYIRAVDPNRQHEIYLEDHLPSIINPNRPDKVGLDFSRVARHFDAVGGYTTTSWDSSPDSGNLAAEKSTQALTSIRKMIGPDKQIIYTFWVANPPEERKPGPAAYPTAQQIQLICEAALKLGIRHLDMYGYRIGEYVAKREDLPRWMPPDPAPYRLTGQFPQKFLWDRPQVHQELADYLRSLNQK